MMVTEWAIYANCSLLKCAFAIPNNPIWRHRLCRQSQLVNHKPETNESLLLSVFFYVVRSVRFAISFSVAQGTVSCQVAPFWLSAPQVTASQLQALTFTFRCPSYYGVLLPASGNRYALRTLPSGFLIRWSAQQSCAQTSLLRDKSSPLWRGSFC